MPAQPTKPHIIQNGCHEKYLHSPLGCVPAMYPTIILNKKKHVTNNWYTESVYAYNVCIVGWGSLGRMEWNANIQTGICEFFFPTRTFVNSSAAMTQLTRYTTCASKSKSLKHKHQTSTYRCCHLLRLLRLFRFSRSTSSEVTFTLLVWKIRRGRLCLWTTTTTTTTMLLLPFHRKFWLDCLFDK